MNEEDPADASLTHWRQGDFALDVGGFLFAEPVSDETSANQGNEGGVSDAVVAEDLRFDTAETIDGILGMVAVSQTCDIVRRTGGRHYVTICPLIRISESEARDVRSGRRPYYAPIELAPEGAFADLRRVMSAHKDLLRTWDRYDGFSGEPARRRFAAALERKLGQFAFPDEFDAAIKRLKERVWSRHDKTGSPLGAVYRSLDQIRFRCFPSWEAAPRRITIIAVLHPPERREASVEEVGDELKNCISRITWPVDYDWDQPSLILATADDLTARDMMTSQRGDFDFLCSG